MDSSLRVQNYPETNVVDAPPRLLSAADFPPGLVLLVSGSTGAGHRIAAAAVEGELLKQGIPVLHVDAYAFLPPAVRWAYTELHLHLLEFTPWVYGPLFDFGSQSPALARLHARLAVRSRRAFERVLARVRPAVVLATHPLGCTLAAPLRSAWGFRLVVLTTDYYANAFQVHPAVDRYCVSHAWTAADLAAAGVLPDCVTVTGIPLRAQFDAVLDRAQAKRALGLPEDRPMILLTRGGMAAGKETVKLLKALLAAPELYHAHVVALLGSRERGPRLVRRDLKPDQRLRAERFVENMATYLAAADVVVGKAGGLSSTEVFAAGRPLIVFASSEGVETANVLRFSAAGAAVDAGRSPSRAVAETAKLLRDPRRALALAAAGRTLLTPQSRRAVRSVIEELRVAAERETATLRSPQSSRIPLRPRDQSAGRGTGF